MIGMAQNAYHAVCLATAIGCGVVASGAVTLDLKAPGELAEALSAVPSNTDELVLTGELMSELDTEQISDLIAYLKQQMIENGLDDPEKLSSLVEQASEKMEMNLTDEQVSKVVDLLLKMSKLDMDPNQLVNQAKELYDKLDELGIKLDKEKVGNFVTRFISSIWDLIQNFMAQS